MPTRRVLVAGVGYTNLRDLSAGPVLTERLRARTWPPGVQVEDLSFGGVHVLHWLQECGPFDGAVFVTAAARGRPVGSVHRDEWRPREVPADEVQGRVAEAVTGVISLDTLLTVVGHFGALPPRVTVVEIEPQEEGWGEGFSAPVERALREAEAVVAREVAALVAG